MSRVTVTQECIEAFNDLKLGKKTKYIIYKLSDDLKEIMVEDRGDNGDWEYFREKVVKSQSKGKNV